jgi:hypothetical protein
MSYIHAFRWNIKAVKEYLSQQLNLARFPFLHQHTTSETDHVATFNNNVEVWHQFNDEHLYDTRRVTLEHFHLFEWFPQAPGVFHSRRGEQVRALAQGHWIELQGSPKEHRGTAGYYKVPGKGAMLEGGVGAVRLRPRQLQGGKEYYFMTASSNGICHEGFPVVLPRQFYGQVKEKIREYGAAPAIIRGEMRYIPKNGVSIFDNRRDIPALYLHVDDLRVLPQPRTEVTRFRVSATVMFSVHHNYFATYATFDPANTESMEKACTWIKEFYVEELHQGEVVTDFDEVKPRFPDAVFSLPKVMNGRLDLDQVRRILGNDISEKQITIIQEQNTINKVTYEGDITITGGVSGSHNVFGHGSNSQA